MKLTQRHLFKGVQEFEIVDDCVNIRTKAPFKTEEVMTVMLTVLDPEPEISDSSLDFNSRVNGEALLSLFLGKPNTKDFNAFVALLKERAREEYNAFAGIGPNSQSSGLGDNVFDEPPEFEGATPDNTAKIRQELDAERISEAIQMLEEHLDKEEIGAFISALNALKADPANEGLIADAVKTFNELGSKQGAVLAYAPYVITVLSDDPFNW